jgi:uncharacterized membrane protein YeaQ/YmgE (transglycosylase-associated protein family)
MNLSHLAVQLVVAIVCAGIGNVLIPRQIPGRFFGFILTGLVGVWVGEEGYKLLNAQYGLSDPILRWNIEGVPVISSIIGSAIVIYVVTTVLKWGRYSR